MFSDYIKRFKHLFKDAEDEVINKLIEHQRQHLINQGMDPYYRFMPVPVAGGWCDSCGELMCECEEDL